MTMNNLTKTMKKELILFVSLLIATNSFAQISFQEKDKPTEWTGTGFSLKDNY